MKFKHTLFLLLILMSTCVVASAQSSPAQEVQQLERNWLNAYEQNDAKAMDAIVGDDFSITFPDGSMQTKSQVIDSLKPSSQPNPPTSTSKFYTENVQVRVYGDTVVLTGRVIAEWLRDGKSVGKQQMRYTDTYVKRQGRWQVVASHLSNENPPKKPN